MFAMLGVSWVTQLFRFMQIGWAIATLGLFLPLPGILPSTIHVGLYMASGLAAIAIGLHGFSLYVEPRLRARVAEAVLGIMQVVAGSLVVWEIGTGRSNFCKSDETLNCSLPIIRAYIGATICKSFTHPWSTSS